VGYKLFITIAIFLAMSIIIHSPTLAAELGDKPAKSSTDKDSSAKSQTSVSGDAKFVFQQASKSVVIVEAYSSSGKIQGSGVAFLHGYNPADLRSNMTPDDIRNLRPYITYVVTNAHVVKNGTRFSVLQKGESYVAVVEYADDDLDLAILRVDGIALAISTPDKGSQVAVGEKVFAIGSPLGLENSITDGIISGKREQNGVLLLQTTAPISKGSSGGGLFDSKARFIGVTTFKLTSGESINFAVDAAYVSEVNDAVLSSKIMCKMAETIFSFSPDEMTIIKSHRFTSWLLNERAENGQKLYVEVKKNMYDTPKGSPEEIEQRWKQRWKQYKHILTQFLRDMGTKGQGITQNNSKTIQLICKVANNSIQMQKDFMLELDYRNRTANGYSANITDAEVSWEASNKEGTKYYYVLNRYSGSIVISTDEFPNVLSGKCYLATERQF
jgi:S1-C subfamily serine protease